jgi:LPS export ABC transporter protein LptC
MSLRRVLLWTIPGLLVAALVWSLLPRATPPERTLRPPTAATQTDTPSPDGPGRTSASGEGAPYGVIRMGDLTGTDDSGRKRWRIVADQVTLVRRRVVLLRGVRATFYAQDGSTMKATGDTGTYDTVARTVDLEGNVHGVSSAGRELFADRLHYSQASDELTGTGHIRLIEEQGIIYADRMVSKPSLDQTRFFGHVHIGAR